MKKKFLLLALCLLIGAVANGQSQQMEHTFQSELLTPSPKASMIERFGSYPVSLYTGLVDITIPIHTIEVKDVKIPIEFKYHASGLKYDDLPMEVGYGWTLSAGGIIHYSARGADASHYGSGRVFIKELGDLARYDQRRGPDSDQLQLDYVMNANRNLPGIVEYRDSEYDSFYYSIPGYSGYYYELADGKCFTNPSTALKVCGGLLPFILDDRGNTYRFDVGDRFLDDRNVTRYLTQIVLADRSDTIRFTYDNLYWDSASNVKRPLINSTYTVKEVRSFPASYSSTTFEYGGDPQIISKEFIVPRLREIAYKGGKTTFEYASATSRSLVGITVYGPSGNRVKGVRLSKTADDAYLDSVAFEDKDQATVYSYRFAYDGKKEEGNRTGVDYWGYYNGQVQSGYQSYVPAFTVRATGYPQGHRINGMNREPNEAYMKKGMLKKITYPTGGYTEFAYEGHRSYGQLYGGLRIKEQKSYDADGVLQESKWYKYGANEDGNGHRVRAVNEMDFLTTSCTLMGYIDPSMAVPVPGERTMWYSYSAFPRCSYFEQGSTVVYTHVTEYTASPTGEYGKTVYCYTYEPDEYGEPTFRGQMADLPTRSNAWKNGKLYRQTTTDSQGKVVYQLENEYEAINHQEHLNLRVSAYFDRSFLPSYYYDLPDFQEAINGSLYDYYNYYLSEGTYALVQSREFRDGVYVTTTYRYNELGQLAEQSVAESDGSQLVTRYKYPYDLQHDSRDERVLAEMYSRNMLAPFVEKEVYKDDRLIDKLTCHYKQWGSFVALAYTERPTHYYSQPWRCNRYNAYGRPVSVETDNLEPAYYLWSYKGQYPVAEVKGKWPDMDKALGAAFMDRLLKSSSPSAGDMRVLEALRGNPAFVHCRITTFYYEPPYGLSEVIAPNGTRTSYEYDSFGRLSRVKDSDGKIVEAHEYDYKQ